MSLDQLSSEAIGKIIKEEVKTYLDHPKPGVRFKDLQSLLVKPELMLMIKVGLIKLLLQEDKLYFNKVLCLDARGFIYGPSIAMELGIPMILGRKNNKLPGELITQHFKKEYGEDSIQVQKGLILPGDEVLIHDDLLATGGTCLGATQLVHACGATVTGYNYIMELTELGGRKFLEDQVDAKNITSLVSF